MRRKDREITDREQLIAIMERCDVCRLGLVDEGMAYIVPLNYGMTVENGEINLYFHCANEGSKLTLLRQNPHVSFEMDGRHTLELSPDQRMCTMRYESVMGRGIVTELPEEQKYAALKILMAHYREADFDFTPAAIPRTVLLKLTVEQLTGKTNIKD